MIPRLEAEALNGAGLAHGFFTRNGGVSTGLYATLNGGLGSNDDTIAVLENRRRMAQTLGVQHLLVPYQIHSTLVINVSRPFTPDDRPQADGMATATRGLALGATGADCGMILFADVEAQVVGAAHSGWKGALNDIVGAVAVAMEELGARRANIRAVLGPCIQQKSYEVGPEFYARFVDADAGLARLFVPSGREGHYLFDLPGVIALRAAQAGIGHFECLGLDTYSEPERFYSYRRSVHREEADYGRLISAIALV